VGDDDQAQGDIKHKLTWLSDILIEQKAHAEIIDLRAKELAARAKTAKNKYENTKEFIKQSMFNAVINKIEGELCTISRRKGVESVFIDADVDIKGLPPEFVTVVPEKYTPIKTALKKALKDGVEIKGVELLRGEDSVTVK